MPSANMVGLGDILTRPIVKCVVRHITRYGDMEQLANIPAKLLLTDCSMSPIHIERVRCFSTHLTTMPVLACPLIQLYWQIRDRDG